MLCLVTTIWWLFSVTSFCKKFLALDANQLVILPLIYFENWSETQKLGS